MTPSTAGLTEAIATFIARTGASDIPVPAFDKAKKVVADTCACIVAGGSSFWVVPS